jgi:excisionase family DNA binding protein
VPRAKEDGPVTDARMLTRYQAAKYLGVSPHTIWRLVNDGTIVPYEVKSKRVYDVLELDAYLARQKDGTMKSPRNSTLI